MAYSNAVLTITDTSTADPYVIHENGKFYMTFTAGDRVEIWTSGSLLDFERRASKHVVWRPPPDTPYSTDLWAPELHSISGRWYIYVAIADPRYGNRSHRMHVLGGPPSASDPTTGSWECLGQIKGMPDQWSIDGTVITLDSELFFIYSGWPIPNPGDSELTQELYIVQLSSATEATSQPVKISAPDEEWERSGDHGINEGPQFLASPDRSWIGIAYSCAGSWCKDYKMATLQYTGGPNGNPLDPASWHKSSKPLLQTRGHPPFGPGHGSFLSLDGEVVSVFHGTDGEGDGWAGRKARVMRVDFDEGGPKMGDGMCGPLDDVYVFLGGGGGDEKGPGGGLRKLLHGMKGEWKS